MTAPLVFSALLIFGINSNIPSMIPLYVYSIGLELNRTQGLASQPGDKKTEPHNDYFLPLQ